MFNSIYAASDEIKNEALGSTVKNLGAGAGLAFYIGTLWKTMVTVGGLAFIIYLVWGGIEYLTSAGDKGRIDDASKKISSAVIGLAILVGSYAVVYFVQGVLKIDLLKPIFPDNT